MTTTDPAVPDLLAGVICPECGCRRLLSERSFRYPEWTARTKRCSRCGYRVVTAEWIDRPTESGLVCPTCTSTRLVCTNTYHKLTKIVRLRRCKDCTTQVRTIECRILNPSRQPRNPTHFRLTSRYAKN